MRIEMKGYSQPLEYCENCGRFHAKPAKDSIEIDAGKLKARLQSAKDEIVTLKAEVARITQNSAVQEQRTSETRALLEQTEKKLLDVLNQSQSQAKALAEENARMRLEVSTLRGAFNSSPKSDIIKSSIFIVGSISAMIIALAGAVSGIWICKWRCETILSKTRIEVERDITIAQMELSQSTARKNYQVDGDDELEKAFPN